MKKVIHFLGAFFATVIGNIVGALLTILCSILAMIALIFRLYVVALWVEKIWAYGAFLSVFKTVKLLGRDKFERGKAYIIVSNHSSLFDIPAMAMVLKSVAAFVAKQSLFRIPIFGTALSLGVCVPVDRSNPMKAKKAIDRAMSRTKQNHSIIIFPEGSRTKDGTLQPFKRGFVKLMRDTGLDILPVTLNGFYTLKPTASVRFYIDPMTRLEAVVNDPIRYEDLKDKDDREIISIVRDVIESSYKLPGRNG